MSVLDFRKALKHREGTGLRQHRPLLMLILLMGIVAMVADNLRRPGLWAMLDRAASPSPEPPPDVIGNHVGVAPRETPLPDSFVSGAVGGDARGAAGRRLFSRRRAERARVDSRRPAVLAE
jgi:hypothetical protein